MKNFKREKLSKNLKSILTLDQLRILLSKFGVKTTHAEIYAALYVKAADTQDMEDFAINKIWYKLYGNMYGLTRFHKQYIVTYLSRIRTAMPKEVDDKQMVKFLLMYLDCVYYHGAPKKVQRVFSNFNAIEFLEQFDYVWKYKKLIAGLKQIKLVAEANDFKYVGFIKKSFEFAKESKVRKTTVIWIKIVLQYMKAKNQNCFKFTKYTEFSEFSQYCDENNMLDLYEALLQQKETA